MLKKIYFFYGLILALLGVTGFVLTHAKSALISGLASAAIIVALSFFMKSKAVRLVTYSLNTLLIGVFSWRFWLALSAFMSGNEAKLIPAALLGKMALFSIIALVLALRIRADLRN
jgi:hypothetical protein